MHMEWMIHSRRIIAIGNIPVLGFANWLRGINPLHGKLFTINRNTFVHPLHHNVANWQSRVNHWCLHIEQLIRQGSLIRFERMNAEL